MFESHGWATIVASPGPEDDRAAEARQRETEAQLRTVIAEVARVDNETVDLRVANGELHLWLAGSHNHRSPSVVELFRSIAGIAPGSYGVMYVLDDDLGDNWQRWVMRRGRVVHEVDTSLSPHIGMVEDPSTS
jgi:hypothetical protein